MEDILPGDMATGRRAYRGGTSTNTPADNEPLASTLPPIINPTLSVAPSIDPLSSAAPLIDPALSALERLDPIIDPILSESALDPPQAIDPILTATGPLAGQSLTFRSNVIGITPPPSLRILASHLSSTLAKRPFSSTLSPDETDQPSVLFSPALPPSSAISASSAPPSAKSFPPSKRSRTSGAGTPSQISGPAQATTNRRAAASGKGTTNVMLQAVDSTLRHLNDHLGNRFRDPLKAIEDALQYLNNDQQIDRQKRRWFRAHLSTNSGSAVGYLSTTNDQDRAEFVDDLYEIHHSAVAQPGF